MNTPQNNEPAVSPSALVSGKPTWDELDKMYRESVGYIVEFRERAEKAEASILALSDELEKVKERNRFLEDFTPKTNMGLIEELERAKADMNDITKFVPRELLDMSGQYGKEMEEQRNRAFALHQESQAALTSEKSRADELTDAISKLQTECDHLRITRAEFKKKVTDVEARADAAEGRVRELEEGLTAILEVWNSRIIQGRLEMLALRRGGVDGTDEERAWVSQRVEKAKQTLTTPSAPATSGVDEEKDNIYDLQFARDLLVNLVPMARAYEQSKWPNGSPLAEIGFASPVELGEDLLQETEEFTGKGSLMKLRPTPAVRETPESN